MRKLIQAFNEIESRTNAKRLLAYVSKHPMALVLASDDDIRAIERARNVVAAHAWEG
jgi:hypothetical protein